MQENCTLLDPERVPEIVAKYRYKQGVVVHLLQDIQREFGYLPEDVLRIAARDMGLSLAQVYGVASFYAQFYFTPRGENVIRVCVGTACHIRGALAVLERFEKELGLKDGETAPDLKFTLETVSCVGCCSLAPVVVVNEKVVKKRDHQKILTGLGSSREE